MIDLKETAKQLCIIGGVSGYEDRIREAIIKLIEPYADLLQTDALGNLIVFVKGAKKRNNPVMLCAHMDEVGALVYRISKEGLLYMQSVGSMDPRVFIGKQVCVGDNSIPGVIGTKAMQLLSEEEKKRGSKINEIYVDIGALDKEDALKYINIGDQIYFLGEQEEFGDGCFMAKAIDDRLLCAVLIKLIHEPLPYDTWFCFTTCEEIGLRGASSLTERICPKYSMILEGTTAADFPCFEPYLSSTRQRHGAAVSIVDNGTFYNRELIERITAAADSNEILWQYRASIAGRTDSGAISTRNGGTKTICISVPTRYNHSQVSHVYWGDVEQVYEMARLFIKEMGVA